MLEFNLSHHTPILQSLLNTNQEIIGYSVIYLMFLYKLIKYNNIKGTMLGSSLPPVVCVLFTLFVFVCMWWCVVFLFCFSSSCVPCIASFSGVSIYDRPLGNVYII